MPKASVILYVSNNEACVAAAIDSVLAQSFADFELIVVDDASTDDSLAVARRFADPRLRVLALEAAKGKAAALNIGLMQSAGDYLAILEATDRFRPERLRQQIDFLETYDGIGAVFSRYEYAGGGLQSMACAQEPAREKAPAPRNRHEWLRLFFFEGHTRDRSAANALCHSSALLRRRVLADIGLYDNRLSLMADLDLWVRLCLRYDLHVLPERLVEVGAPAVGRDCAWREQIQQQWEFRKTLERFQTLSTADLLQAFPESRPYLPAIEARWIPCALARMALAHGGAAQRHFGQDILYALLDPGLGFDLPGRTGLHPVDLHEMVAAGPVCVTQEAWTAAAEITHLQAALRDKMDQLAGLERTLQAAGACGEAFED